jgi:hypothetical protein
MMANPLTKDEPVLDNDVDDVETMFAFGIAFAGMGGTKHLAQVRDSSLSDYFLRVLLRGCVLYSTVVCCALLCCTAVCCTAPLCVVLRRCG